jgi:hypothetical protein
MGTYTITKPSTVGSHGGFVFRASDGAITDAAIIGAIASITDSMGFGVPFVAQSITSGTIRFGFTLGDAIISLDGNPAISFNSLPSGFTPSSAIMSFMTTLLSTGNETIFLQLDSNTESSGFAVANQGSVAISLQYNFGFPQPSILDILANGFGVRLAVANINDTAQISNFQITGNYNLLSYSWTLPVTTGVKAGDLFTINGDPNSTVKLDSIVQVIIKYIDSSGKIHNNTVSFQDFVFQSQIQIQFWFPQFGNIANGTTVDIFLVGNGTQFSGSVLLGSVTIIFADSSGIYQLIPGKRTDTIYDRSLQGATKDVNIPDPFIKTALIP